MINIKEERLKRGLSQIFVAKELSISREYLSRIENYKVEPSNRILERINLYFGGKEDAPYRKVIY